MPFANPVVTNTGTLIKEAIRSPDFVAGVSGWSINRDGSAEFNDVTLRGSLDVGGIPGIWIGPRTDPDFPAALFAVTAIKSAIVFYQDASNYGYIASSATGGSDWTEYGIVDAGVRNVAYQVTEPIFVGSGPFIDSFYDLFHRGLMQLDSGAELIVDTTAPAVFNAEIDYGGSTTVQNVQTALQTTTSAVFVLLAATCGVAFVAPPSGQVTVDYAAFMQHSAAGQFIIVSPELRTGSSVGAGTVVSAANDDENVQVTGTDGGRMGATVEYTGLTPGNSYNVSLWTRTSAATATIRRRRVVVAPAL
jgi:hypothetical protein